ncbi:MAG: ABC transporter permease [Bacillota bacterium]
MWFEWFVALRLLREGRIQTGLILGGVAVGVAVTVFLSGLIDGLQRSLIDQTLGSQPHITLRAGGPDSTDGFLRNEALEEDVAGTPGVTAVSPVLSAPAFALAGDSTRPVTVQGIVPARFNQVIDVAGKLKAGTFRVEGAETIIGTELAAELGIAVGDTVELRTADGASARYKVTALLDLGNKEVNRRWALLPLEEAQGLFDRTGQISAIHLKVADIFAAEAIGADVAERSGLTAEAWSQANAQLLTGLRSQSSSSYTIQFFIIMSVALGIASVLVVSVVQKSREIGILKAIGTSTSRVLRIFLIQGGLLGIAGSVLGCLMGVGLSNLFTTLVTGPDGAPLFSFDLSSTLFIRSALIATGVGLLAAVAPARRAAKLQPATVIRYG